MDIGGGESRITALSVDIDTAGHAAGLKPNDVITKLDGKPLTTAIADVLRTKAFNTKLSIRLTVTRGVSKGKRMSTTVAAVSAEL